MTTFQLFGDTTYLSAMEWMHGRVAQTGGQAISFGPDLNGEFALPEHRRDYAHRIERSKGAFGFAGIPTEGYSPMFFLVGPDGTLQAVFTGYLPVYTLLLRNMAVTLSAGQTLWSREQLDAWREVAKAP